MVDIGQWEIPKELKDVVRIIKLDKEKYDYDVNPRQHVFRIYILEMDEVVAVGLSHVSHLTHLDYKSLQEVFEEKFIPILSHHTGLDLNLRGKKSPCHNLLFCYDKNEKKYHFEHPNFSTANYLATLHKYDEEFWKDLLPAFANYLDDNTLEAIIGRAFFGQETEEEWRYVEDTINKYSRY